VANLSVVAVSTAMPEILINIVETVQRLGLPPGELGPSAVVGSAGEQWPLAHLPPLPAPCSATEQGSWQVDAAGRSADGHFPHPSIDVFDEQWRDVGSLSAKYERSDGDARKRLYEQQHKSDLDESR
jgi:hypothetical protein